MVYGCGNKCVKYLVFAFNFLVCVVGAAVLGVSLMVAFSSDVQKYAQKILDSADNTGTSPFQVDQIYYALYVLAAVGAFLFLTGFLGCCGACCENTCLLGMFFAVILILFVAELACGIAILIKKSEFKQQLEDAVTKQIQKYYQLELKVQTAINKMQHSLQCCGCTDATFEYSNNQPASCCKKWPDDQPFNETITLPASNVCPAPIPPAVYTDGCCAKVWNDLSSNIGIVAGVAIGILVVELMAMIFSCILCQAFRRGDYHAP